MPKRINTDPEWHNELDVPRDGEGIDAADVELPLGDLLSNTKFILRSVNELQRQLDELKAARGGFTLLLQAALSAEPARSYTVPVNIGRLEGFAEPVDLEVQGLPAGATASFAPDNTSGSLSTMTLAISAGTPAGVYDLSVIGTSATRNAAAGLRLTVAAATLPGRFDFEMPSSATITRLNGADSTTLNLNVTRQGGFGDAITFSAPNLPAGLTATFAPNPVSGSASTQQAAATMTLAVTGPLAAGTYNVAVRGTAGALVVTRSVSVTVAKPTAIGGGPDFSIRVEYDAGDPLTVNGATVWIERYEGFTGTVSLLVSAPTTGAPGSTSWTASPVILVDGSPWSSATTGNRFRITANGAPYNLINSGVAPIPAGYSGSASSTVISARATINGEYIIRTATLSYRWGTKAG